MAPLHRLIEQHHERLRRVCPERCQNRYGPWRPVIADGITRCLERGDWREGIARVPRPGCGHELLVALTLTGECEKDRR